MKADFTADAVKIVFATEMFVVNDTDGGLIAVGALANQGPIMIVTQVAADHANELAEMLVEAYQEMDNVNADPAPGPELTDAGPA